MEPELSLRSNRSWRPILHGKRHRGNGSCGMRVPALPAGNWWKSSCFIYFVTQSNFRCYFFFYLRLYDLVYFVCTYRYLLCFRFSGPWPPPPPDVCCCWWCDCCVTTKSPCWERVVEEVEGESSSPLSWFWVSGERRASSSATTPSPGKSQKKKGV